MKRHAHACLLAGVVLSTCFTALAADLPDIPYREIASRNSFGLKALEHPDPPKAPVVWRPKIRLAGITTILGTKIVFLTVLNGSAVRQCLMLVEGQRQDDIEVTQVDAEDGIVKVVNHGQEQTLNFDENDDTLGIVGGQSDISLTPEQQSLVIEAQRLKAIQDGDPMAKILPPTDLTPDKMANY